MVRRFGPEIVCLKVMIILKQVNRGLENGTEKKIILLESKYINIWGQSEIKQIYKLNVCTYVNVLFVNVI